MVADTDSELRAEASDIEEEEKTTTTTSLYLGKVSRSAIDDVTATGANVKSFDTPSR